MEEKKNSNQSLTKYTEEELYEVIRTLQGKRYSSQILLLMKSKDAKEAVKRFAEREADPAEFISNDDIEAFVDVVIHEFARNIDKRDFERLKEVGCEFLDLIELILDHPEYQEGGLSIDDKLVLMSTQKNRKKAEHRWEKEPKGNLFKALNCTEEEKEAVKMYTSEKYFRTQRPHSYREIEVDSMYEMYNTLFFPGLDNEKSRIYEEGKEVPYESLNMMENMLKFSRNFYTALYKTSRKIIGSTKVSRVDRVATLEAMEENDNVVVSNFSTTLGSPDYTFSKKHTAIVTGTVTRGVVAADFAEILKDNYYYNEEKELLIAPGAKVDMKEETLSESEKNALRKSGQAVERKVSMDFYPQGRYIDPLTPEEKRDMTDQLSIILDPERERDAKTFIRRLMQIRHDTCEQVWELNGEKLDRPVKIPTVPFEEVLDEIGEDIVESYLTFKEAFRKYYDYMTREVAMEVESSLERANESMEAGIIEEADDLIRYGKEHPRQKRFYIQAPRFRSDDLEVEEPRQEEAQITDGEMQELVKKEKSQDIHSAVETFGKTVGDKDILVTPEDGIEKR